MGGLLFCSLAFLSCSIFSMSNWRIGLCVLVGWGYVFGVLKAHFFASFGHFIFDSATIGFYLGLILKPPPKLEFARKGVIAPWTVVLIGWPTFVALVPIQHYLVQLVGLRGNIFWLPMMIVGTMIDYRSRTYLTFTLSILNIFAFSAAIAEFFLGVDLIVPENEVTQIVFMSGDVADGKLRIPSTFANAHSYALTMVQTIPWIVGELLDRGRHGIGGMILISGLLCAILGVFMAGPRQPVIVMISMVLFAILTGRVNLGFILITVIGGTFVGLIVAQDERFQRFLTLADTQMVSERVMGSLDLTFWEVLADYPMGNGMGAGGTSLPYFIQALLERRVMLENEYARIFLEQGFIGFILWMWFIIWFLTRRISEKDASKFSKNIIWIYTVITFGTAWIGIGTMSLIPATFMLFLGIGYCLSPPLGSEVGSQQIRRLSGAKNYNNLQGSIPAYQRGLAKLN